MSLNTPRKTTPESDVVIHRAGWIMADPETIIPNGYVRTQAGRIIGIGSGKEPEANANHIDHGPGILMPGLVNAHTHLELTALKDQTDMAFGFIEWVQSVIDRRASIEEEQLVQGVVNGLVELTQSGSLLVGEIASLGLSFIPFVQSQISGIWFQEFLGTDSRQPLTCETINALKKRSVAGHAPHTTASDLLVRLKKDADAHGLPYSLHLAESVVEIEFLTTGKGAWADFLQKRNIEPSVMQLTGAGPVKYADQLGLLNEKTLAVHLVFADQTDYEILSDRNVSVCLCPRSNQNLHQQLPNVPQMIKAGLNLCLGTDSLASNDSLSVFDEMRFLSRSFPEISLEEILTMATINGAKALGFGRIFGRLAPGYSAKFVYLPLAVKTSANVLESIIFSDVADQISMIC